MYSLVIILFVDNVVLISDTRTHRRMYTTKEKCESLCSWHSRRASRIRKFYLPCCCWSMCDNSRQPHCHDCGAQPNLDAQMFIILGYLSFMDDVYFSTVTPHMDRHLLQEKRTISFKASWYSSFVAHLFEGVDIILLAEVAYDHHLAICKPCIIWQSGTKSNMLSCCCWPGLGALYMLYCMLFLFTTFLSVVPMSSTISPVRWAS